MRRKGLREAGGRSCVRAYIAVQPDVPTVAGNAGSPGSQDEGRPADRKLILKKNSGCGNIPFRRRVGGEDASPLSWIEGEQREVDEASHREEWRENADRGARLNRSLDL